MNDPAASPLVWSCSGCSSAAQLASHAALQLDRRDIGEMSCICAQAGDAAQRSDGARR
ncbi:putative zinc-binding protein [Variovorax sp. CF079]|uniref:putative zinc-binding protein n=1 Tax=Variovorax sp. CF079 TaxID=1882774 RepID=UPI000B2C10D9|nr:putative zinc-binding protein [Variovorax sp. CF079]